MRTFGIGERFIKWISTLYSSASALVNVNGFLSTPIPFKRGVRQGCPLSSMLYVMVIEVLALQLRANPNIVGFQIEQEKIVSAHYMDDTTIIIKQNRCFKEVIKELTDYEEASSAKVNYKKSRGLWTGSWKGRRNTPLGITWTSKNVKNLGVFFGNTNPALHTFNDIIPKVEKRLNYWKQFKLSIIGKARAVDIFLASTLVYAIKFYKIPTDMQKELCENIYNFIKFPEKAKTISQEEMWRLKNNGGIKLVNIKVKSEISKAKWLVDLVSNPNLKVHLHLFESLLGVQKGHISGRDLIFLEHSYIQRILKTDNQFYKEALLSITALDVKKGISSVHEWDNEHLFYNKFFSLKNENKPLSITTHFQQVGLYKFGQFLDEKAKNVRNQPSNAKAVTLCDNLILHPYAKKENTLIFNNGDEIKFTHLTHKQLYEATITNLPGYHHSQEKWFSTLNTAIDWDSVWYTVHNFLNTHKTTSLIWQQIHLNFYTQYSYNKWKKVNKACPLCDKIPQNIFHLILHCDTVVKIWKDIEPTLLKLHPTQVCNEEMAFGLVTQRPKSDQSHRPANRHGIHVRNWLTYLMRRCIANMERKAHYSNYNIISRIKLKINNCVIKELDKKLFILHNNEKIEVFDKFFAHKNVLCKKKGEATYQINKLFHHF